MGNLWIINNKIARPCSPSLSLSPLSGLELRLLPVLLHFWCLVVEADAVSVAFVFIFQFGLSDSCGCGTLDGLDSLWCWTADCC